MGYTVEVSFDTRKHKDITDIKHQLKEISYNCGGDGGIFLHEFEGIGKSITSNICVFISCFDYYDEDYYNTIDSYYYPEFEYLFLDSNQSQVISPEAKNCQLFIHKIRMINNVFLETIYTTEQCKLLYASRRFLNRMKKEEADNYLNNKVRRLSDEEELLINTIKYK